MEIFERFLKEVDLSQLNNDDTIDFLTIKNIHKMFKLGRRRVIDHVVGKAGNESLGMPLFVECIYRMQHHWSPRVYEVAFLISSHYLVGYLGRQTPILTDLTSELVQYNMQEPEEDQIKITTTNIYMQAKKRNAMGRKGSNDSSIIEDENTEEEDNRNRAITFLMSAAEKRAFEVRKRHEKAFNERFKKIFTAVVATYLAC